MDVSQRTIERTHRCLWCLESGTPIALKLMVSFKVVCLPDGLLRRAQPCFEGHLELPVIPQALGLGPSDQKEQKRSVGRSIDRSTSVKIVESRRYDRNQYFDLLKAVEDPLTAAIYSIDKL